MNKSVLSLFSKRSLRFVSVLLITVCIVQTVQAEEKVKSVIKEVQVYFEGAQVSRLAKIDLPKGVSELQFDELPAGIDPNSLQVKAPKHVQIQAISSELNYLGVEGKTKKIKELEERLKKLSRERDSNREMREVYRQEESLLMANKKLGGEKEGVSIVQLKQAADFYRTRLTEIKLKLIELESKDNKFQDDITELRELIQSTMAKQNKPSTSVHIKLESKLTAKASLVLNYFVKEASWAPLYDVRVSSIQEPLELQYKAMVQQTTGEDWSNVNLTLSSGNPSLSGIRPEIATWELNTYSQQAFGQKNGPQMNLGKITQVSGQILSSEDGLPIPSANVMVKGSSQGGVTDIDGNYSIKIPENTKTLVYSFMGMKTLELPVKGKVMNVILEPDLMALEEVMVVAYGRDSNIPKMLEGQVAGVQVKRNEKNTIRIRGISSIVNNKKLIDFSEEKTALNLQFKIKEKYSIPSNGKEYQVDMKKTEVGADYTYYCTPKLDSDAFLVATLVNWEKLNLLDAPANLYLEGTYIGTSYINTQIESDSLQISLGRDKSISVSREKIKEFKTKKLIGSRAKETFAYNIKVKNTKNIPVRIMIQDQVPVSTMKEIEIKDVKYSEAKYNKETGILSWEYQLAPGDAMSNSFQYTVDHPKYMRLVLEK